MKGINMCIHPDLAIPFLTISFKAIFEILMVMYVCVCVYVLRDGYIRIVGDESISFISIFLFRGIGLHYFLMITLIRVPNCLLQSTSHPSFP